MLKRMWIITILLMAWTFADQVHGQVRAPESSIYNANLEKISGTWRGKVAGQLEILFHIHAPSKSGDPWNGKFDVPAQSVKGFDLEKIVIHAGEIRFQLGGVPGNANYSGKISADAKTITGRYMQGAINIEMDLKKDEPKTIGFDVKQVDSLAEKLLKDWNAPGLAIAIVKDGKILHSAGYGFKDVEKKEKMTADTLLAIGSCTKAFTTTIIARLVEEGKLDWDTPVNQYWPAFRMVDTATTQFVTLRDMVTHRTGLPRHDLIWFTGELTRADILSRVPYLAAAAPIRQKWIYNNIMFATAGAVAETAAGKSWEVLVRDGLLNPLEMKRTNFHIQELKNDRDHATGYHASGVVKDGFKVKPYREIAGMAPAGSINSSAKEMAAWMNFQLGHIPKNADGKPVLKENSLKELQSPQMIIASNAASLERADVHSMGYAMGWGVESYRGHRHVEHGGAIDGFVAQVELFPDDDLGIVALVNQSGSSLPGIICQTIADRILKFEPIDWSGQALAKVEAAKKAMDTIKSDQSKTRPSGTKASHELKDYTGIFHNPGYGRIEVRLDGNQLVLHYGMVQFPLEHWHYDVFSASKTKPEDDAFDGKKFQFQMDVKGSIVSISTDMEPMAPTIVFHRTVDPRLSDPKFLASLAGKYELAAQLLNIELEGKALKAVLPGQPVYKLLPDRGLIFNFEGLNGFRIEFQVDEARKVSGVTIEQPNGTFTGKKKSN